MTANGTELEIAIKMHKKLKKGGFGFLCFLSLLVANRSYGA
jgi:hypothetical protein